MAFRDIVFPFPSLCVSISSLQQGDTAKIMIKSVSRNSPTWRSVEDDTTLPGNFQPLISFL